MMHRHSCSTNNQDTLLLNAGRGQISAFVHGQPCSLRSSKAMGRPLALSANGIMAPFEPSVSPSRRPECRCVPIAEVFRRDVQRFLCITYDVCLRMLHVCSQPSAIWIKVSD